MRFAHTLFFTLATVTVFAFPVSAEPSPAAPEPADMWECPMEDGTSIYTNKERSGCREVLLRPLSVVPSLDHMPPAPHSSAIGAVQDDRPLHHDRFSGREEQAVPDWAREWHASIAPSESARAEVCSLYSEWLHLAQKTRGGVFFGSDPSYGGELSAGNQRGHSQSFYDNARWITLSRLFGTGFVPVGCP
jgi:hypothetical protein